MLMTMHHGMVNAHPSTEMNLCRLEHDCHPNGRTHGRTLTLAQAGTPARPQQSYRGRSKDTSRDTAGAKPEPKEELGKV